MKKYLKIASKTFDGMEHNEIQLRVEWDAKRKRVDLSIHAGQSEDGFFSNALFTSPHAYLILEQWPRNNQKKLNALRTETFNEVDARSGRGWVLLSEFLTRFGLELELVAEAVVIL